MIAARKGIPIIQFGNTIEEAESSIKEEVALRRLSDDVDHTFQIFEIKESNADYLYQVISAYSDNSFIDSIHTKLG